MNKYKSLIRNTAILSTGTLLSKAVTFFMTRFYTDILTPDEYGTGDLLITTVSLLMPVVSFGIAEGIFRFLPEYSRAKKSIFSIGIYTVSAGMLVLALLFLLFRPVKEIHNYFPLLAFMTLTACYHSVCEQYIRADGYTVLFAKQGLLNTLLVVMLNILLLSVFKLGITGYVLSVGLADLICTLYIVLKRRLWQRLTLHPNKALLIKMLRYSVPLIPTTIFWWITGVSDRYMIAAMLGKSENGIYTVANKLPTLLTLLSGVLMQAWQYSAVNESKSNPKEQSRFYGNVWLAMLSVLFLVCSAMIAFSKIGIRVFADESYYTAWKYMPVLCAATLFCAFNSFMGSVYTVKLKSNISFLTALLGALINIALNALLIPSPLGMYGAALSTFASYFAVFLIRAVNARRLIRFRLFKGTLWLFGTVLILQILFICFEWPYWQYVQCVSVITVLIVGQKQIIRNLPILKKIKNLLQ